jgi:hypothetical protein
MNELAPWWDRRTSFTLSFMWHCIERTVISEEADSYQTQNPTSTLILDFSDSITLRNKFMSSVSYSVYGILLKLTKIQVHSRSIFYSILINMLIERNSFSIFAIVLVSFYVSTVLFHFYLKVFISIY